MKKRLLKLTFYLGFTIVLIYVSIWLFSQLNHSFPSYFTIYPENFNEDSFKKITIGNDKEIVEFLIGKPLRKSIYNHYPDSIMDIYWYTKAKSIGLSYDKIYIVFYNDNVAEIVRIIDMD